MNPENFHLEFYESDGGTMPVLEWLNKLESSDGAKHDAVVYGLQVILAREGAGVCGTEFGKNLGKGLCEFRLRHTRDELQAKAEPHKAGSARARIRLRCSSGCSSPFTGTRSCSCSAGTTRPQKTLATARTPRSSRPGPGCGPTSCGRRPN
jgi:hypothetical protein